MQKAVYKTKLILLNKKEPDYYIKAFDKFYEKNELSKAEETLLRGNGFYPNNRKIHQSLASFYFEAKEYKKAIKHYEFLMQTKGKKFKKLTVYLNCAQSYEKIKEINKAIESLEKGLEVHPKQVKIKRKLISLYSKVKKIQKAIKLVLEYIDENEEKLTSKDLLQFSSVYNLSRQYEKSDYLLRKAIEKDKENVKLWMAYVETAVMRFKWQLALERISETLKLKEITKTDEFELEFKRAMLNQVLGNVKESKTQYQTIFLKYKDLIEKDKEGNRKIILFDNGESRIEFYKKMDSVDQIIISFDSLHMDWNEPAFGYVLLKKQSIDIIAVRKRKKSTYQQDLTQEDFINTVAPLAEQYSDRLAYGHSLGGYLSLYYASNIKKCRILSLAPRLSIHPVYGRKTKHDTKEFLHNLSNNYNANIEPIIVYDPRDRVDGKYVHEELLAKFPNSILVKMPYGGHGIARHLLRMGELKNFILTVIEGDIPKYNRKLKHKSGNYCRLLARKCLSHNKLNWADQLSCRALELLPSEKYAIKMRVDVLVALDRNQEAIEVAKKAFKKAPKNLYKQLIYIDCLLKNKDLLQAEYQLSKAKEKHGETNGIKDREMKLKESYSSFSHKTLSIE